jgi:hypothetical protein
MGKSKFPGRNTRSLLLFLMILPVIGINSLNFGIDRDDYFTGTLDYAAPEIIRSGKHHYIFVLNPWS